MSNGENFESKNNDVVYKMQILLSDIETVKKFVAFVNNYEFPVLLVSDRYIINGKSIMGIFGLDLSKPVELRVLCECPDDFKEKIQEFRVEV